MEVIVSLNDQKYLYDYKSMGIKTFFLGCPYSFYSPNSFDQDTLKTIVNDESCDFYVLINSLYDQNEIGEVESYIDFLSGINVKGIVFQDFGVLEIVNEKGYDFTMIYNPETLNTNIMTINALAKYGVDMAIISKVIPLEEALLMKQQSDIPLIFFGHGKEYVATTKRELLTNYGNIVNSSFNDDVYQIQANGSDMVFDMYEDQRGTHIFTNSRLYTIDLFNTIHVFEYLLIDTFLLNEYEAVETASLYTDALKTYEDGTYGRDAKFYKSLLIKLNVPLSQGFLFDNTVYKLDDVRKIENEKR